MSFICLKKLAHLKKGGKFRLNISTFFLKILSSTQIVGISPVINLVFSSTLLKN